jgi:hypothetical protein
MRRQMGGANVLQRDFQLEDHVETLADRWDEVESGGLAARNWSRPAAPARRFKYRWGSRGERIGDSVKACPRRSS